MSEAHPSFELARLWSEYFGGKVPVLWEIGSRDGVDAIQMARSFPSSRIWAFEPNPATFDLVARSATAEPRIVAVNAALSDVDGPVTFHQIDPDKTETTWADGNPGASSLFQASGAYPHETYVQRPIVVDSIRGDSMIGNGTAPLPDFIWMDVQGAELLVLNGLGEYLSKVSMIYVELSLLEMYFGQALAPEVVALLRRHGFSWHSVPRQGTWQIDAVFVRCHRKGRLLIRDLALSLSLRTPYRIGIERSSRSVVPAVKRKVKRFVRTRLSPPVEHPVEKSPSGAVSPVGDSIVDRSSSNDSIPASPLMRQLTEMSLPDDPLAAALHLPPIQIVIPCAEKDLAMVTGCVLAARRACRNSISEVLVVVADDIKLMASSRLGGDVVVVGESELGIDIIASVIDGAVPAVRRGWVLQQALKLTAVARSSNAGVLVLDADTLLVRPRTWLGDSRQILCPSHEFHTPYAEHTNRVFGALGTPQRVSYVTHHQLMRPDVVRKMFGAAEYAPSDISAGLADWVTQGDYTESSALSEYHSYGTWLLNSDPNSVVAARWGNQGIAETPPAIDSEAELDVTLRMLWERFPMALSVSFHEYLRRL